MPPNWSSQSASWLVELNASLLVEPECLLTGWTLISPDWSSQSASWLVKPECLLIGWARVPPDWSSQSASWLVEPESLLIVCTRVPPDRSSQNASWLVELECLLIGHTLMPPDWSNSIALMDLILNYPMFSTLSTDRQTRVTSRDASASKNSTYWTDGILDRTYTGCFKYYTLPWLGPNLNCMETIQTDQILAVVNI